MTDWDEYEAAKLVAEKLLREMRLCSPEYIFRVDTGRLEKWNTEAKSSFEVALKRCIERIREEKLGDDS